MIGGPHYFFNKKILTGLPHLRHVDKAALNWVEGGNLSGIKS
jgi:hypothetical protein